MKRVLSEFCRNITQVKWRNFIWFLVREVILLKKRLKLAIFQGYFDLEAEVLTDNLVHFWKWLFSVTGIKNVMYFEIKLIVIIFKTHHSSSFFTIQPCI